MYHLVGFTKECSSHQTPCLSLSVNLATHAYSTLTIPKPNLRSFLLHFSLSHTYTSNPVFYLTAVDYGAGQHIVT